VTALPVRPARPDDRDFVLSAAKRLADFEPPAWRSAAEIVEGDSRTLRVFFERPPAGSALLVAQAPAGLPLGFVYLETLSDYFTGEAHGHIGILAVVKEGQGKGIGGRLLRAAEDWARARGHRKLTLSVFEQNRHARDVYEHLGYAPEVLRYVKPVESS
jgi:GNAT superfamily N-acetyltransferase